MDSPAPTAIDSPRKRRASKPALPPRIAVTALILQPLPRWITARTVERSGVGNDPVPPAFADGAALFALDQIIRANPPWLGALRLRQALKAAAACARILRLNADEAALRDTEYLTRPGDDPGPVGRLYRLWRAFAARPVRLAIETIDAAAKEAGPEDAGREIIALMLSDLDLAAALGWPIPVPLTATVIFDPALRGTGGAPRQRAGGTEWPKARQAVLGLAAVKAHAEAVTLQRRAAVLIAAAGRLRTRAAELGLTIILADDAVAPWRMAGQGGFGSDRAARRFCERLRETGALRLLTDRPTFRLYGL